MTASDDLEPSPSGTDIENPCVDKVNTAMQSPNQPSEGVDWLLPLFIVIYLIVIVVLSNSALKDPSVVSGVFGWIAAILVFPSGIVAFWLRQRHRISYGLLELAIGVYLTAPILFAGLFGTYQNRSIVGIDVFAGLLAIYVVVRALDNIGKGLKKLGTQRSDSPCVLFCKFKKAWKDVKVTNGWRNRILKIRDHWETIFGFD